ncbi:hypothetical protein ACI7BZ_13785 [Xanthobacter sp. AM11]|uniref:hypothetical protein n=1 Tax=Xanthobacter sp. AM11 TaxID=3380643 RepID=UPI0039BF5D82
MFCLLCAAGPAAHRNAWCMEALRDETMTWALSLRDTAPAIAAAPGGEPGAGAAPATCGLPHTL